MSATTTTIDNVFANEHRQSIPWLGMVGVVLCFFGTVQLTRLMTTPDRMLRDFVQEWTSARNWQVGRPVYQDMRESIPFHLPQARPGDLHFNAHPPVAVLVALPFGTFGYSQELRAWNLMSLICVAIALWGLMGRHGFRLPTSEQLLVSGLVLSSSVLESQVLHGQLNGLLFLLLTGAWLANRHNLPVSAGLCIGLATSLKLFPGLLVLFFLARRQWKAAFAAVGTGLLLNAAAAGILGFDAIRDYVLVVMPQAQRFCDTWPNASLLGGLTRLLDGAFGQTTPLLRWPQLARFLWIALSVTGIMMTWRATSRSRSRESEDLAFTVWIGLMLLISPITWDHYFLLAVLPLIALWKHSAIGIPSPRAFLICAALLLVVLSPYTVWRFLVPGYAKFGMTPAIATPAMLLTVVSFQFYVTTALFAFGLRRVQPAKT